MTKWEYTLNVAGLLDSDDPDQMIKNIVEIASRLQISRISKLDEDVAAISEELTDAAEAQDSHWFDLVWNAFYDWADGARVWVKSS